MAAHQAKASSAGIAETGEKVSALGFEAESVRSAMRLYAVTDDAWLDGRALEECVAQAVRGGASFVQLRDKRATTEEMVEQAAAIIPHCRAAGVPFVINDNVEAALRAGADGVHVGQDDAACAEARRILGPQAIVGVSVQTLEQALEAQAQGASYVGVGAMFATSTKSDAIVVSFEELEGICGALDIPVVAIGGINESTLPQFAGTGVDGVAVVSAIFAHDDIEAATRRLSELLEGVIQS